jgi:hypothetical protein
LASRVSEKLKVAGFSIVQIGNAPTQNFQTGKIYFLNGEKTDQLNTIEKYVKLELEKSVTSDIWNIASPQADILIILGANNSDLEI